MQPSIAYQIALAWAIVKDIEENENFEDNNKNEFSQLDKIELASEIASQIQN